VVVESMPGRVPGGPDETRGFFSALLATSL
jgi:hypothetical protein